MLNNFLEQISRFSERWFEYAYSYLAYLPPEEEPSLYTSAVLFGLINGGVFGYLYYVLTH